MYVLLTLTNLAIFSSKNIPEIVNHDSPERKNVLMYQHCYCLQCLPPNHRCTVFAIYKLRHLPEYVQEIWNSASLKMFYRIKSQNPPGMAQSHILSLLVYTYNDTKYEIK